MNKHNNPNNGKNFLVFSLGRSRRILCVLPLFMVCSLLIISNRLPQEELQELFQEKGLHRKEILLDNALDNGWISNSEILDFANNVHSRTHQVQQQDEESPYVPYTPSLTEYPLNLLQNFTSHILPTDVLYLWHIPKAAGSTVKHVMMKCFHLTRAEMKQVPESFTLVKGVLNIDTSTIAGIYKAKEMGLVDSNFVDVIETSYLHEGAALLTENHKGRLFTVMRHPVDTAISLFYYLGWAKWERNYQPELMNMTLLDYVQSNQTDLRVDNWMTRYLSRRIKGPLDQEHFQLAKNILKYKCLIGMSENMTESMNRLATYAGLGYPVDINNISSAENSITWSECVEDYNRNRVNKNKHQTFKPGSMEWDLLAKENQFDIKLFSFAKKLWSEQGRVLKEMQEVESNQWNYRPKPPQG